MTENSDAAKAIADDLAPLMKSAGFRKRGNSFNRKLADDCVNVVSLQLGAYEGFRTQEIECFPSLYGTVTVNLGMWIPGMNRWADPPGWISESRCQVRYRLGVLMPIERDEWWPLDEESTSETIATALEQFGLPALDRYPDENSVLLAFESNGRAGLGFSVSALDVALACKRRGEDVRARRVLETYVQAGINPRHVPYLIDFLNESGWPDIAAKVPLPLSRDA